MTTLKGCAKKQSWPNLLHIPEFVWKNWTRPR